LTSFLGSDGCVALGFSWHAAPSADVRAAGPLPVRMFARLRRSQCGCSRGWAALSAEVPAAAPLPVRMFARLGRSQGGGSCGCAALSAVRLGLTGRAAKLLFSPAAAPLWWDQVSEAARGFRHS